MIIKTNNIKILNDKYATSNFKNRLENYIRPYITYKDSRLKKWDEYFKQEYEMNLNQACLKLINSVQVISIDDKCVIKISPTYDFIYKAMCYGILGIRKTSLLENAFKYACRKM